MFELEPPAPRPLRQPVLQSEIDAVLTAQFVISWAGEGGEQPRLSWWRSDFVSEFGGQDLFERILPHTWRWAVLQGAREAARRHDARMRARAQDPDTVLSLFSLGFELNERVDERLRELKGSGADPTEALPGLSDVISATWDRDGFADWVRGHGPVETIATPAGRRIRGESPSTPAEMVRRLVAALDPLADDYPLPHFRRTL